MNCVVSIVALGILIPGMADAHENCTPGRFVPGASFAVLRGIARSTDDGNRITCYTLATARGQAATSVMQLRGPKDDTAFAIVDVVDNPDKHTGKPAARTYQIAVHLTFARQAARPLALDVPVR